MTPGASPSITAAELWQRYPLDSLLERAYDRPCELAAVDELEAKGVAQTRGAHRTEASQTMQGFRAADAPAEAPWFGTAPSYAMPSRWHRNTHEWQLRYTHPALRNPFLLEVFNNNGLVLLRLVEDTSLADTGGLNVHQLGLNLGIYVPDPEHLQATSWDEALEWPQMKRFTQHWHRNIYLPTRATAARASGEGAQGAWGGPNGVRDKRFIAGMPQERALAALAVIGGAVGIACAVWFSAGASRTRR